VQPSRCLVLVLLAALTFPTTLFAQTQRLGLPPTLRGKPIVLQPRGKGIAPCYCLDQSLRAPNSGVPLYHLQASGEGQVRIDDAEPISLIEALRTKQIELRSARTGGELGIEFANNTDKPIKIEITKPPVFGDDRDRKLIGADLGDVAPGETAWDREVIQERLWKKQQEFRLKLAIQEAHLRPAAFARANRDGLQLSTSWKVPGLVAFARDRDTTLVLVRSGPEEEQVELRRISGSADSLKSETIGTGRDAVLRMASHVATPQDFIRFGRPDIGLLTFFRDAAGDTFALFPVGKSYELVRVRGNEVERVAVALDALAIVAANLKTPKDFVRVDGVPSRLLSFYKDGKDTCVLVRTDGFSDGVQLLRVRDGKVLEEEQGLDAAVRFVARFERPQDVLLIGSAGTGVQTFYKDGASTLVLVRTGPGADQVELRRVTDGKVVREEVGQEALVRVAAHFKTPSAFQGVDGLPRGLLTFCRNGEKTLALLRSSRGELQLWERAEGKSEIVARGDKAIPALDTFYTELVARKSDEKTVFLHVPSAERGGRGEDRLPRNRLPAGLWGWPSAEGYRLHVGKDPIPVSREQMDKLLRGEALDPALDKQLRDALEGKTVTLVRDAAQRGADLNQSRVANYDPERVHVDSVELLLALQQRYPKARLFLDDPEQLDLVKTRLEAIPKITRPQDVAVVHDSESFTDFGVFKKAEDTLKNLEVKLVHIRLGEANRAAPIPAANLIVLTGHKDENFRAYVRDLNNNGLFNGKVVALMSCYERNEEAFNSQLLARERGTRAIVYFAERIDRDATAMVLQTFAERLGELKPEQPAPDLKKLLDASIEAELKKPNLPEQLKIELQKMRRAVIQVSDARSLWPSSGTVLC
jgi:hypothetical protein